MSSRIALGPNWSARPRGRRRPMCATTHWKPSSCARSRRIAAKRASSSTTRMRRASGVEPIAVVVDTGGGEPRPAARPVRRPARDGGRAGGRRGRGRRRRGRRRGSPARTTTGSVSVNTLPCAGRALTRDVAAEQAREVARDRQAEAGAAVLAVRAAVGLPERLEDDVLLVRAGCRCRCRARRTRRVVRRRARRRAATTSPRSVNLSAFDSRFFRIWPSRCASVSMRSGVPGSIVDARTPGPSARASGSKRLDAAPRRSRRDAHRLRRRARPCPPRSSTGRGCR